LSEADEACADATLVVAGDFDRDGDTDLAGYTRDANNEIRSVFPTLPNPTLVMYVYAHLTAQGHPVPGYATAFQLYEKNHYALPGEAEGW
ncbi:MAG: TIGR03751 family conjugal transfer lipoprotein, partial [Pseudomonadota bacterium]